MSLTTTVAPLLCLLVGLVLVLAVRRPAWRPAYVRRPLMTPNEHEFFRRLGAAARPGYVFPQVAMSALVAVKSGNERLALEAFRKISQKRVDYAIFDPALRLSCVVELDDSTHDAARDRNRDALLSSAGIRTIRWDSRCKPSVPEIRAKLLLLGVAATSRKMAAR